MVNHMNFQDLFCINRKCVNQFEFRTNFWKSCAQGALCNLIVLMRGGVLIEDKWVGLWEIVPFVNEIRILIILTHPP